MRILIVVVVVVYLSVCRPLHEKSKGRGIYERQQWRVETISVSISV